MKTPLLSALLFGAVVLGSLTGARADVKMETRSTQVSGSKVTVVHFGAPWCGPCVAMEPAVHEFEGAFAKRVSLVMINVDQKGTPEYKQYHELVEKVGSIPYTIWLDSSGKPIGEGVVGGMSAADLKKRTESAIVSSH